MSDMLGHQWMSTGGDGVTTKWVCVRCGTSLRTANSEDDFILPEPFHLQKKGIPLDCNECVCKTVLEL